MLPANHSIADRRRSGVDHSASEVASSNSDRDEYYRLDRARSTGNWEVWIEFDAAGPEGPALHGNAGADHLRALR